MFITEFENDEPVIVYENVDGKCSHPLSYGDASGDCGEPVAIVYPGGSEAGPLEAKRALADANS